MISIKALVIVLLVVFGQNEARVLNKRQRQSSHSRERSPGGGSPATVAPCRTGTCLNGGVCFTFGNVGMCVCPPGYGGLFCQILVNPSLTNPSAITVTAAASITNLCLPNPCLNGGLCLPVSTNLATCACPKNFTGIYCQLLNGVPFVSNSSAASATIATTLSPQATGFTASVDPAFVCFTGACLNGGTCLTIGNLGLCMCLPNFSGSRCEFPQNGVTLSPGFGNSTASGGIVTPCNSNNPCLNNSTCLLINGNPTCFCSGGLLPPFCSGSSSAVSTTTQAAFGNCVPNPCQNNQPCILIQGQPVCFCAAGLLPPLCTGTTTPSITTVSGPGSTSVVATNCPVGQCNGNPCLIINGVQTCFCTTGAPPNCV